MLRSEAKTADPDALGDLAELPSATTSAPASAAAATPLMLRVERVIARLAAAHEPMPNFAALAERACAQGRQSANKAFEGLIALGRVAVEVRPGERRVCVVLNGEITAWCRYMKGHGRSRMPQPAADKPARPDYLPDGSSPFRFRTNVMPLVNTSRALSCQRPLWGWAEKPTHRYCGNASVGGTSWCLECLAVMMPDHPHLRAAADRQTLSVTVPKVVTTIS